MFRFLDQYLIVLYLSNVIFGSALIILLIYVSCAPQSETFLIMQHCRVWLCSFERTCGLDKRGDLSTLVCLRVSSGVRVAA